MAKMILDTSSWIDLAKPRFQEILDELIKQVDNGHIILLANDIIVDEWNRNKKKATSEAVSSIKSHAKSALTMAALLGEGDAEKLKDVVEKYKLVEDEQLKFAEGYIERVENILLRASRVPVSSETKIFVVDKALKKAAPFHNSKNNVADALIFYSTIDYMEKEFMIATDLFFVTMNYNEFSDPKNREQIHPELLDTKRKTQIHFYDNVGRALKMKSEVVDELDEYHEYQFWSWIEMEAEIARGK